MLTPFISSFRIEFVIIFAATIATGMIYYQDHSSSTSTNKNKARGRQRNLSTAPGTPSGIYLDSVDGNRSQSGTPNGISHYEHETSGNNLTSAGSPSGTYLPNDLPTANPTSANQTETDNALPQTNKFRTYDEKKYPSGSIRNNNTETG